jgi:hypothetical protein
VAKITIELDGKDELTLDTRAVAPVLAEALLLSAVAQVGRELLVRHLAQSRRPTLEIAGNLPNLRRD